MFEQRSSSSRLVASLVVPAIVVLAVGVGVAITVDQRARRADESEQLRGYAGLLGRVAMLSLHDAMKTRDRGRINAELNALSKLAPIRSIRIHDHDGSVRFSSDINDVGKSFRLTDPGCSTCHAGGRRASKQLGARIVDAGGRRLFRTVIPIRVHEGCTQCHDKPVGATLGVLIADLDDDALTAPSRADGTHLTATLLGLAMLAMIALVTALRVGVVRPLVDLNRIVDGARRGAPDLSLRGGGAAFTEVARSVQNLTLDLDGRFATERIARRMALVIERAPGAVLLTGPDGRVFLANTVATRRFAGGA